MRAVFIVLAVLLGLALADASLGAARAEPMFHLPCDPGGSLMASSGLFRGRTESDAVGKIRFERFRIARVHLEAKIFDACRRDDSGRPEIRRRWLGRLSLRASTGFERTQLQTNRHLTGNGLTQADLDTGFDQVHGAGLGLSLFDAPNFHLEAFYDWTGTHGWNNSQADAVVARVWGSELDVTERARNEANIRFSYRIDTVGMTLAVPLGVRRVQVTPYANLGYAFLEAAVRVDLHADMRARLSALSIDPVPIEAPRNVRKSGWSGMGGVRIDFGQRGSLAVSMAHSPGDRSTLTAWEVGVIVPIELPSLRNLLRLSAHGDNLFE